MIFFFSLFFRPRGRLDRYFSFSRTQRAATVAAPLLETLRLPVNNTGHSSDETVELSDSDSSSSSELGTTAAAQEEAPAADGLRGLCCLGFNVMQKVAGISQTTFPNLTMAASRRQFFFRI